MRALKSFPPISFKITIKGVEEMNYRIETKDAFRIAGVSMPLNKDIEKNFAAIPTKCTIWSMDTCNEKIVMDAATKWYPKILIRESELNP